MEVSSSDLPRIGWKATAGSLDKNELITQLQSALLDEIAELKKGQPRECELYEGKKVSDLGGRFVYCFQSGDLSSWRRRRRGTQIKLTVDDKSFYGLIDSWNRTEANIAFETDMGEFVEKATVEDSSFDLLQNLHDKLKKVKAVSADFNTDGSMKLFGFIEPKAFLTPISLFEQKTLGFRPNVEQQRAIRKSMSQEVTFIWGPPGTGKTKTLSSVLNNLIRARRSVLLTANTHRAVDEILKKFIEDPENQPLIQEGKIVRLGIPDEEDESFDCILLEKVAGRRTAAIQESIAELDTKIELLQETSRQYGEIEKSAVARITQKESQIREYEKIERETASIQDRQAVVRSSLANAESSLSNRRQLLEKAKSASAIKRFLSGLNKEQIEAEIASILNQEEIARLELQSLQKQFEDRVQEKTAISNRISQYRDEIEPSIDGITTLEALRQRKLALNEEAEDKSKLVIELQTQMERAKESVFNEALVLGSTIARASLDPKIIKRRFDTLVVDEASMASLPNMFFLAGLCSSHYIISGDFRQLSPIAKCRSGVCQQWLKRDIFTQAGIVESVNAGILDDERLVMLREQYRMHHVICSLISDAVYERKLKTPDHVSASKEKFAMLPPFEGRSLIFCDTAIVDPLITRPEHTFSRLSPYSAAFSSRLAAKCIEEGENRGFKLKVGVVTPYREQAKLISKMLEDEGLDPTRAAASTIHRFQGTEKDVIIFDLVEGKPLKPGKLTEGTFKNSEAGKLLTVAISRAMGKFILVGNSDYIKSRFLPNDAVRELLDKISQNGEGVDSCEVERTLGIGYESEGTQRVNCVPFPTYDQTDFYDAFRNDMKKAKSRIVIFSPFVSKRRVADLLPDFREILANKVPIYVVARSPEHCGSYKTETIESLRDLTRIGVTVILAYRQAGVEDKFEKFHYKVAVIDNSVVYYGSLNILSQFDSAESMMAFTSKKTVAQLTRVFRVSEIIKGKRFGEDTKTSAAADLEMQGKESDERVPPSTKPLGYNKMFETLDTNAIEKMFGVVDPGRRVRQQAEQRLWTMGKDLGFSAVIGYEEYNLLSDGRSRFISVVWRKGNDIIAAFQVRRKKYDIDIVTRARDWQKLKHFNAVEKYIVNVSDISGKACFHRVTNWKDEDFWTNQQRENKIQEDYSLHHTDKLSFEKPDSKSEENKSQINPNSRVIMEPSTLARHFGSVEVSSNIYQNAKNRIREIGTSMGYFPMGEYFIRDIVAPGRWSKIDMVWKAKDGFGAAFVIKSKYQDLDKTEDLEQVFKLRNFPAENKFVVNVSKRTGDAYFNKID